MYHKWQLCMASRIANTCGTSPGFCTCTDVISLTTAYAVYFEAARLVDVTYDSTVMYNICIWSATRRVHIKLRFSIQRKGCCIDKYPSRETPADRVPGVLRLEVVQAVRHAGPETAVPDDVFVAVPFRLQEPPQRLRKDRCYFIPVDNFTHGSPCNRFAGQPNDWYHLLIEPSMSVLDSHIETAKRHVTALHPWWDNGATPKGGPHREEVLAQDRRHGGDDGDLVRRDAQLFVRLPQRRRHVVGVRCVPLAAGECHLSYVQLTAGGYTDQRMLPGLTCYGHRERSTCVALESEPMSAADHL